MGELQDRKIARAGDIVAIGGLKDTVTGETLCASEFPVILERMDFPEPVIKIAIEPKTKGDLEKMGNGLYKLGRVRCPGNVANFWGDLIVYVFPFVLHKSLVCGQPRRGQQALQALQVRCPGNVANYGFI